MVKVTELGCAGHFICAADCHWHRHTQVGQYRISTVGNFYSRTTGKRETLAAQRDSFFESMVFITSCCPSEDNDGCGCQCVTEWSELECDRYATAGQAQKGHEALIKKYRKMQK